MGKNCDTCKHWERLTVDALHYKGAANPDDFGKCQAALFDYWHNKPNYKVYVMDGSQYYAELVTRRDHGCNLHNADLNKPQDEG